MPTCFRLAIDRENTQTKEAVQSEGKKELLNIACCGWSRIILLEYGLLQVMHVWKDHGFHHLIHVTLAVQCTGSTYLSGAPGKFNTSNSQALGCRTSVVETEFVSKHRMSLHSVVHVLFVMWLRDPLLPYAQSAYHHELWFNEVNAIGHFGTSYPPTFSESLLGGVAGNVVNGFDLSDDNYDNALILLKERFGREEMVVNAHMSKLLSLYPVKDSNNLVPNIKHRLKKYSEKYTDTVNFLNENIYVDDIIGSQPFVNQALTITLEVTKIFEDASISLYKWQTNSKSLHKAWQDKEVISDENPYFETFEKDTFPYKVLGIVWNSREDFLYFDIKELIDFVSKRIDTKRFILQVLGRIFDPIGFLGPFTLRIKHLMQ
ncbi:uncharacterized protein TNCV_4358011 [Trichonephila clavipes]|nr:uncharacterized protein TNCV_4358011 [Trichonephila clavipes]